MKHSPLTFLSVFTLGILSTLPAFSQNAEARGDTLYYEVNARLLVQDRQTASNDLAAWAEVHQGYFTMKTLEQIDFRLPDESVTDLLDYLEEISEEVVEYNQNTRDLREELLSNHSALEAREEILAKNISYIASSDVEGTLTLEKEIRRLMNEIDMYRGMIRRMENDRRYARISVMLTFRNQSIPDARPSRFNWINTVDFYNYMQHGSLSAQRGFGGPDIPLPAGFALIDKSPEFLAISPEGVRMRVRKTENYPEKDAAFWQEALFSYLSGRGYIGLSEEVSKLQFENQSFAVRFWGVPYGNEDYIYITGIKQERSSIQILEIAGPAQYVKDYFP
jgi:uncharacterized tellurite resistance protein B-like protein